MVTSTLTRFIVAIGAATVVAGATFPAHAKSDTLTDLTAPRWVDQTVYRPDCRSIACDCGCRFEIYCEPDCGRW